MGEGARRKKRALHLESNLEPSAWELKVLTIEPSLHARPAIASTDMN